MSIHHGGGVGIGRSIHAGMVCVADGTELAAEKLDRVLTADPGTGRDAPRRRRATSARSRSPPSAACASRCARPSELTVLPIREIGDPVLRNGAREVTAEELALAPRCRRSSTT